jgi:NADPH:quinone reductase
LHDFDVQRQGRILSEIAALIATGRLRPIATKNLQGLTVETMKMAHELLESSRTIGKVVITTA